MRVTWLSLFASLALYAGPAGAQDEAAPPNEAREAFERGHAAYEEGRFADAAAAFERCFELTQDADVLYNLANAYDRDRRDADALDAYRRFLALRPDATDREQIEGRIAVLERTVATRPPEPTEAAAPPAEPPAEPPSPPLVAAADPGPNVGAWSLIGVGAATLVAGVVLLALAQADVDAVANGTRWADVEEAYGRAPVISGVGVGALGLGLALTASGAVWLAVGGEL